MQKKKGIFAQYGALALSIGVVACALFAIGGPLSTLAYPQAHEQFILMAGVVMCAMLCLCAYFVLSGSETPGQMRRFLIYALLIVVAFYVRFALINCETADYEYFLTGWVNIFRTQGFSAITQPIGDYNLPYQYILALIAKSPVKELYLIKLVSIVFDFALALLLMRITQQYINARLEGVALALVLFAPTVILNGSYWAQCDTLYVFFVMASFYALLKDHPTRSVAWMAIAFSFKLQTIFFFPMVLFGLKFKKYKLRHAVVFPLTYLATLAPALLAGRSLSSALQIYANQSLGQYVDGLSYNAANPYILFPMYFNVKEQRYTWLTRWLQEMKEGTQAYLTEAGMANLQSMALVLSIALVLVAVAFFFHFHKRIAYNQIWGIALFSALFLPMVLPKMHDRYFFMAEMFAVLYAMRHPRRFYIPAMVIGASLISYEPYIMFQVTIPLSVGAALNLMALVFVVMDLCNGIRNTPLPEGEVCR